MSSATTFAPLGACASLGRLENPIWIFDITRRAMWRANPAAVARWGADTLAALVARDFEADMSEATRTRLDGYLLAFEAAALDEDRERCLRSGCDAHTTRPVDRRSLFQTRSSFLKAVSTP